MKSWTIIFSMLAAVALCPVRADDAPKAAPTIKHVPVTTTTRGVPVSLVATVENHSGTITQSVALVRITDLGVPQSEPLERRADGTSEAVVPVSLLAGVESFWYSLTVSNDRGGTTSTHWQRVQIVDGGSHGKATALLGAALLGGGVAAYLIANNDNGGSTPPPPPPATNAPPKTTDKPCVLSGSEGVSYGNYSASDHKDITVLVCRTCPNATVRADATWGESAELKNYNNWNCDRGENYLLHLPKPPYRVPPPPNTYTIEVTVNGQLIDVKTWPPTRTPTP